MRPDGAIRVILDRGVVERDAEGRATLLRGVNIDITDGLPAGAPGPAHRRPDRDTMRQHLQELESLYAEAPLGLALLDRELRFVRINPALAGINGFTVEEHLGRRVWDLLPDLRASAEPALRRVLEDGVPLRNVTVTGRTPARPGVVREWVEHFYPLHGDDGTVEGIGIVCEEVTDRRAAEAALLAAHDTFRQLVERSPFGLYTVDADFRLVHVSEGAQKVFENVSPLIGRDFAEVLRVLWREPFASEAIGRFRHTLATGESYRSPATVERRADVERAEAYDWKIERIAMPDGRPGVVCHFYDLTERQAYQDRIETLMREVNHRAKNMLALVDAIARLTVGAVPPERFFERFSTRLRALAASQDLLMRTDWDGADLGDLVRGQLLHFEDLLGTRVMIAGPAVHVGAQAAQTLGMALHELATNAAKYGALSDDNGTITISWRIEPEEGVPGLAMSWIEDDGPAVAPPQARGFGHRVCKTLVEGSLGGRVVLDYAPDGLRWSLRCPLAAVGRAPSGG